MVREWMAIRLSSSPGEKINIVLKGEMRTTAKLLGRYLCHITLQIHRVVRSRRHPKRHQKLRTPKKDLQFVPSLYLISPVELFS